MSGGLAEGHEGTGQEPPPTISPSSGQIVIQALQQYGWFILIGGVLLYLLWGKLEQKFRQFQDNQEQISLKKYDHNTAQKRMESMEMSRRRLQEQYDTQAQIYAEHQKKKEEEKRQERIEDWDRHLEGKGYRNKFKPPADEGASSSAPKPKKKTPLRPSDYNPLMGAGGGGAGFRPAPRSSGGG